MLSNFINPFILEEEYIFIRNIFFFGMRIAKKSQLCLCNIFLLFILMKYIDKKYRKDLEHPIY